MQLLLCVELLISRAGKLHPIGLRRCPAWDATDAIRCSETPNTGIRSCDQQCHCISIPNRHSIVSEILSNKCQQSTKCVIFNIFFIYFFFKSGNSFGFFIFLVFNFKITAQITQVHSFHANITATSFNKIPTQRQLESSNRSWRISSELDFDLGLLPVYQATSIIINNCKNKFMLITMHEDHTCMYAILSRQKQPNGEAPSPRLQFP